MKVVFHKNIADTVQLICLQYLFTRYKTIMKHIELWFKAARPWSLVASFIPVALGIVLAAFEGIFRWEIALLTLIGGCLLQVGTNLINTYGDFVAGVDTKESSITCPQLTHGMISPRAMFWAGVFTFALVALRGIYFVSLRGWPILIVGLIGILSGYGYTAGIAYKYQGLGVVLVFFLMGPLMVWGGYYMQTGVHSWLPILASLPIGFLVSGILHGNDYRDMVHDQNAKIKTSALMLGNKGSLILQDLLAILPFVFLGVLVVCQILPWPALLPFVLLPKLLEILRTSSEGYRGSREKLAMLELMAVKLHLAFGVTMILGIAANMIFTNLS